MANISELRKFVVPEFVFGVGARFLAGKYARNLGISNTLLVSDPGVIAAGWLNDVIQSLDEAGVTYTVFSEVSPNPREHEVMSGVKVYDEAGCNGIIALGGGSPIDCAKGIGVIIGNRGNILDYEGVDTITLPGPPLICIPTTAGTAADVSQFAIILDTEAKNKIAIISKMIVPDVALIDPETTVTMDPFLTACTGLDALTHAIEALCSNANSEITDMHARHAMNLVRKNLVSAVKEPLNLTARSNMALASLEAGMAFSNASLGAVHAMAHSLGGYLDLPHGECNAILLGHVLRFNAPSLVTQLGMMAESIGVYDRKMTHGELIKAVAEDIDGLRIESGVTQSLGQLGVRHDDVGCLAEKALHDPCLLTNPRVVKLRDIEVLYEESI